MRSDSDWYDLCFGCGVSSSMSGRGPDQFDGPAPREPRLLVRIQRALATRHYSPRTAEAYTGWMRRFVAFHGGRHPAEMGEDEVSAFISALATQDKVSASTQNQALASLVFLYSRVLGRKLGELANVAHAKRPDRLPVVMTRDEVALVIAELDEPVQLIACLLYGAGLRLQEALTLRVKDWTSRALSS